MKKNLLKFNTIIHNKYFYHLLFFLIFYCMYLFKFNLISDDYAILKNFKSIDKVFIYRWNNVGRILPDSLGYIFLHFNKFVFAFIAALTFNCIAYYITNFFSVNNNNKTLVIVMLNLLLLPFNYLYSSAGYIMTYCNYVLPFLFLLINLSLTKYFANFHTDSSYLLFLFTAFYVCNQDQYAILLLFLTLLLMFFDYNKCKNRKIYIYNIFVIILIYLIMYNIPGHLSRMTDYIDLYIPNYSSWNFFDKLFHGYTSTVAQLFFNHQKIVFLLYIYIYISSFKNKKIFKFNTFFMIFYFTIFTMNINVFFENELENMPDINYFKCAVSLKEYILIFISIIFIAYIVLNIIFLYKINSLYYLAILTIAFLIRVALGFSHSLYRSSFRTFIPTYFFIVVVNFLIYRSNFFFRNREKYFLIVSFAFVCLQFGEYADRFF